MLTTPAAEFLETVSERRRACPSPGCFQQVPTGSCALASPGRGEDAAGPASSPGRPGGVANEPPQPPPGRAPALDTPTPAVGLSDRECRVWEEPGARGASKVTLQRRALRGALSAAWHGHRSPHGGRSWWRAEPAGAGCPLPVSGSCGCVLWLSTQPGRDLASGADAPPRTGHTCSPRLARPPAVPGLSWLEWRSGAPRSLTHVARFCRSDEFHCLFSLKPATIVKA